MRKKADLPPGTNVEFRLDGNAVTIVKAEAAGKYTRGARLIAQMRGRGDVRRTTDEIISLTRG